MGLFFLLIFFSTHPMFYIICVRVFVGDRK